MGIFGIVLDYWRLEPIISLA